MYEKINLGPQKRSRDDSDLNFNLASSYRRAYPDDVQNPSRCGPYYDRMMLPQYYRQRAAVYRPGVKNEPAVARYFSARRVSPDLALLPFRGAKVGGRL